MANRFWKTVVTATVVTFNDAEKPPEYDDLVDLAESVDYGEATARMTVASQQEITRDEAAKLAVEHGGSPEDLGIRTNDEGDAIETVILSPVDDEFTEDQIAVLVGPNGVYDESADNGDGSITVDYTRINADALILTLDTFVRAGWLAEYEFDSDTY